MLALLKNLYINKQKLPNLSMASCRKQPSLLSSYLLGSIHKRHVELTHKPQCTLETEFQWILTQYLLHKIRNVKMTRTQVVICKTAFGLNIDISMPVLYVKEVIALT